MESAAGRSDAALVQATRRGDRHAFSELYSRHAPAAMTVARGIVREFPRLDADDLVAESFARILTVLQAGKGPEAAFRPYLFATVRNTATNWGRATKETPVDAGELALIEDPYLIEQASIDGFERSLTVTAFLSLQPRWQEVLWYSEVEGMSHKAIGPMLGLSPAAVAVLAHRAREGLRQAWIQAHLDSVTSLTPQCEWVIVRLGQYARDKVGSRDSARLEAHLADCRECTAAASEAREVGSHLTLVLLILFAGTAGATAYIASLSGGAAGLAAASAIATFGTPGSTGATATGTAATGAAATGTAATGAGVTGTAAAGTAAAGVTATGAAASGAAAATAAGVAAAGVTTSGVAAGAVVVATTASTWSVGAMLTAAAASVALAGGLTGAALVTDWHDVPTSLEAAAVHQPLVDEQTDQPEEDYLHDVPLHEHRGQPDDDPAPAPGAGDPPVTPPDSGSGSSDGAEQTRPSKRAPAPAPSPAPAPTPAPTEDPKPPADGPPTITPVLTAPTVSGMPPRGVLGSDYTYAVTAAGSPAPALAVAGALPQGMSLQGSTLIGRPAQDGVFPIEISASNAAGTAVLRVTLVVDAPPRIRDGAPTGTVGQPYSFGHDGATAPGTTFSRTDGRLPDGLVLAADGTLSGTPAAVGTYTYTVSATNGAGTASATRTITIDPAATASTDVIAAPASIRPGALESDDRVRVFSEAREQVLATDVTVGGVTIPAGTRVNTFYVHADAVDAANVAHHFAGTLDFGSPVLAAASTSADLQLTDALFGAPGTEYPTGTDRGLEYDDSVTISASRQALAFSFNVYNGIDGIRVITLAG